MAITIRPFADPGQEIDITHRLTAAIAEELWRLHGGNDELNWLEAERHLEALVGRTPRSSPESTPAPASRIPSGARARRVATGGKHRPRRLQLQSVAAEPMGVVAQ